MINGIKYFFKPKCINDTSEILIHWLVHSGSGSLQKKILSTETFDNKKIRLNHYIVQSLEYWQNIKMTRGDVSVPQNENVRNMDIFYSYEKEAIIKDDILKQIIENDLYDKNGGIMKFYNEYNNLIDNNSIEKPEQDLVNQYILEDDVVIELGARYGTVSCAINKKLKNKKGQISVEPDDRVWNALDNNKIKNNCNFNIIKGFISNKKLDLTNLISGYGTTFIENNDTKIPSYSLDEIKTKYGFLNSKLHTETLSVCLSVCLFLCVSFVFRVRWPQVLTQRHRQTDRQALNPRISADDMRENAAAPSQEKTQSI